MQTKRKYYNILTTEGANEATILIYDYIGDMRDWYTGEQIGVTDIAFVQELERLSAQYPVINVRINSPGGEVFHGSAIVNAIRNCKSEVHTWIDGVAASMAGVIWMAGAKRHMAKNGMLMIHSASGICMGNAADMREMADTLDAFDQSLITSCADALGMSEDDMKKKYFDGKDHWLTWNDVDAAGWLSAPDNYQAADTLAPENIMNLSYRDLVALFEKHEEEKNNPQGQGFLQKVRAFFEETAALFGGHPITSLSPAEASAQAGKNKIDMTLDEFKTSIQDGTLDIEAVKAFLAEQSAPPAAPAEPTPNTELETLKAQVAKLTALIADIGKKPGESKSAPGIPGEDPPTADGAETIKARMAKINAALAAAADKNEPVTFTIAQ